MNSKSQPSTDVDGPSIYISREESSNLYVQWSWDDMQITSVEEKFQFPLQDLPFVLRLYDITDRMIKGDGLDQYVDFHINPLAPEWMLFGLEEGRSYCVELGIRMIDGRYYSLHRSNTVS